MENSDLEKLNELPESMPAEVTRSILLELVRNEDTVDEKLLVEAMAYVADRHWHTYTVLDEETRSLIDDWVLQHWNWDCPASARRFLGIIAKLGLIKSTAMLQKNVSLIAAGEVKKEVIEALQEFGKTVADPYSGLK